MAEAVSRTLKTRRSSKRSVPETDFSGRPLFQSILPETDGIKAEHNLPHPGDRVSTGRHGVGTVLSVGEMAKWGRKNRSIEVRFDDGDKWFVSLDDLEYA